MAVSLSSADQTLIEQYKKQWQAAQAAGNSKGMEDANNAVEDIRAAYGYSGGADGSQYIPLEKGLPSPEFTPPVQPVPLPNYPSDKPVQPIPLPNYPTYPEQWPSIADKKLYPAEPPTSGYVPQGTYNDAGLSEADKARIESLQYQWQRAMEVGDIETAQKLHEYAEAIRAENGYSGGEDGSQYIPLDLTGQTTPGQTPAYTPGGYYEPPTLPSANSAEQYIKDLYAARQEAILQAYKTAYDANVNTLDAAAGKIPAQYQAARNQAAAQSEIQKANFNEYAAASGLNTGAGGQAMLAMGNQLQGDLSGLGMAEADAMADLELQRTQIATQYQNDIAQAIADGKLEEAGVLYGEFVRIDSALRDTALQQAYLNADAFGMNNDIYNANKAEALQVALSIGDFSGMAAYDWLPELIAAMEQQWLKDNPD